MDTTHLLAEACCSCTGWDQKGSAYGYCTADASGMAVKTMHDHPCHVPPALRMALVEEAMDDVLAQEKLYLEHAKERWDGNTTQSFSEWAQKD